MFLELANHFLKVLQLAAPLSLLTMSLYKVFLDVVFQGPAIAVM
jgi:hypothetical protein